MPGLGINYGKARGRFRSGDVLLCIFVEVPDAIVRLDHGRRDVGQVCTHSTQNLRRARVHDNHVGAEVALGEPRAVVLQPFAQYRVLPYDLLRFVDVCFPERMLRQGEQRPQACAKPRAKIIPSVIDPTPQFLL